MHKFRFPDMRSPNFKRHKERQNTYTDPACEILDFYDKEALTIFNQVTENKSRLINRKSFDTFYTKKTVKTVKFDSQGKEIIEKFESTSYGGLTKDGEKVGELIQQYSNEKTGLTKTSLQRNMGNSVRRTEVKLSIDVNSTKEYFENLDGQFERDWEKGAKDLGVKKILGFEKQLEAVSPKRDSDS